MKILALGEVMMRMTTPEYKLLSQTDSLTFLFSGTGMNVMSGLHQMGHETYLATTLPDNAIGTAAKAQIRKLGINDQFIRHQGHHIGVYFLETGIGMRPSRVTYLERKSSAFGRSTIADYDFDTMLTGVDAIHLCGITLALNKGTRELALTFVKKAKNQGIKVIFDCNFRPTIWDEERDYIKEVYEQILHQADIVFANSKDAELLLGFTTSIEDSARKRTKDLLIQMRDAYNIETIFGTNRYNENNTDFIRGFMLNETGITWSIPFEVIIYDRVGGGDAFAAGALHGLFTNMEPEIKLVNFATASGILGHTTYGDSPILTTAEIIDFMTNGGGDIRR